MPLAVLPWPFEHGDWLFELKYDGFRALAYVEDGLVNLVSRKGNIYKSFTTLCHEIAACLDVKNAILDGEIVHLDAAGKPQFYSLLRRRSPQQFIAFDLVWLNGKDLTRKPLGGTEADSPLCGASATARPDPLCRFHRAQRDKPASNRL